MYASDFLKRLKKLNPRLRVHMHNISTKFPGVEYVDPIDGPILIGAIDKNYVPEYSKADKATGRMVQAGWRRMLDMLLTFRTPAGKPIVTRAEIRKQFGAYWDNRQPNPFEGVESGDKISNLIEKRKMESMDKVGVAALSRENILEAGALLDKKKSDQVREDEAKEKWLLKKDPEEYLKQVGIANADRATSNWKGVTSSEDFNKEFNSTEDI